MSDNRTISTDSQAAFDAAFPAETPPNPTQTDPGAQPDPASNTPPPPAAPPVPDAVVTPEPKVQTVEPAQTDPDLEAQLNAIEPKSPQQKEGFGVLKGLVKKEREERKKAEQAAAELKKQLDEWNSKELLTPEIKEQLKELEVYQRAEAPEKDPEIQEKFIKQLEARSQQAITILKNHDLKESVIDAIQKAGGIAAISNSNEVVPALLGGEKTWSEWLTDVVLPKLPIADRKRLERIIADTADLSDGMQEAIVHAKANVTERQKAKAEQMGKLYAQGAQEMIKSLDKLAQKWEAKPDDTEETKAMVKKHNDRLDKVGALYREFESKIQDPQTLGKLVVTAAQSVYLMEANQDLANSLEEMQKKYKELEDRHNKVKVSTPTAHVNQAAPAKNQQSPIGVDSRKAVEAFLSQK